MNLYHGTDKAGYLGIMDSGFRPMTYFTPDLGSAISMGGAYVLAIDVPESDVGDSWQVRLKEPISPGRILFAQRFRLKLLYVNRDALIDQNRKRLADKGKVMCEDCKGRGEYREDKYAFRYLREPGGADWKTREPIKVCEICKGTGWIPERNEARI